jgi:hypothetical protein
MPAAAYLFQMTRPFQMMILAFAVAAGTACASRWPAQQISIAPGSVTGDSALEGAYQWQSLDGKSIPVEFPANSGRMLVYGTLDLHGAMAARNGTGGTYSMRFTEQPMNDTVRTTGNDGTFAIHGDTLLLAPTGQASPTWFRYAWRPTGQLALTDAARHVWVYARR